MRNMIEAWDNHTKINEAVCREDVLHTRLIAARDALVLGIDDDDVRELDFLYEHLMEEYYIEESGEPVSLKTELEQRRESAEQYFAQVMQEGVAITREGVQILETAYVTFREDMNKVKGEVQKGLALMLVDDFAKNLCLVEDKIINESNSRDSIMVNEAKKLIVDAALETIYSMKPAYLGIISAKVQDYFGNPLELQADKIKEYVAQKCPCSPDMRNSLYADIYRAIPNSLKALVKNAQPDKPLTETQAAACMDKMKLILNDAQEYRNRYLDKAAEEMEEER